MGDKPLSEALHEERVHVGNLMHQARIHTKAGSPNQQNDRSNVITSEFKDVIDRKEDEKECDQTARQKQLQQTCEWAKSKDLIDTRPERLKERYPNRNIFVDDVHKVLYCEVPKVACTSWKVFFANISGKVDPKDYGKLYHLVHNTAYHPKIGFKYLTNFSYEERLYRLKNYFKFLVVRNPFDKLLSAYENKFAHDSEQAQWYHKNVGPHIIKHYRQKPTKDAIKWGKDVQFEELVRFITDDANKVRMKYDPHWWSMQDTCYPCIIQYDYIAKIETLQQDLPYIMDKIVPGQKVSFPYLNSNQQKLKEKLDRYYKNLTMSEMKKVEELYLLDNKMFGYSLNGNAKECHG